MASVHTNPMNPTYESATLEWKFSNAVRIQNRVDAKSGYFLSIDVTKSTSVLYRECSRRCRALRYRFFISWTSVLSIITGVELNLVLITVHFNYTKRMLDMYIPRLRSGVK